MKNKETKIKLDKLKKIEDQNRGRAKKFLEKQRKDGKKQISAILTADAYKELCNRRDASLQAGNPLTTGDIISALLLTDQSVVPDLPKHDKGKDSKQLNIFNPDQVELDPVPEPATASKTNIIDEFILKNHKKGGCGGTLTLKEIAKALMNKGIKTSRGMDIWKPGTVDTAFKSALKRQERKK